MRSSYTSKAAAPAAWALAALVAKVQVPRATTVTVPATAAPFWSGAHASRGSAADRGRRRPYRDATRPPKEACTTRNDSTSAAFLASPLPLPPSSPPGAYTPRRCSTNWRAGEPAAPVADRVAPTAKQFLAVAGEVTVVTPPVGEAEARPSLPAARTGKKSGCSHAKASTSAAM